MSYQKGRNSQGRKKNGIEKWEGEQGMAVEKTSWPRKEGCRTQKIRKEEKKTKENSAGVILANSSVLPMGFSLAAPGKFTMDLM